MKPLPFSIHNAILTQVQKEDMIAWAKKDSVQEIPKTIFPKIQYTKVFIEAFGREIKGLFSI